MEFNAKLVEAVSGICLSPRYDDPKPTPEFHREMWALYTSNAKQVAVAAPRNHAKSTALTHDFILVSVLFRQFDYVILLGSSEEMAIEHLTDIAHELHENDDLIREFEIHKFIVDQKTDIIVQHKDGHQFRIIARGAEQKIRGRKWKGKRPGLIVADDVEDDEQVESKERREKFRKWFFRAAKQALRDGGKIRIHGTILHDDSLLARLMKNSEWVSKKYSAHCSFDDFTDILWPEKFSEERLRGIRQEFIEEGDAPGYSQEYLNDPFDNDDAMFRVQDFLAMSTDDALTDKIMIASADFAVSKDTRSDFTALGVGGKDIQNVIHIVDVRKGRWNALEIIEQMFELQRKWKPQFFFVEGGSIATAILPSIYQEMQRRDVWINLVKVPPMKDKKSRCFTLQKRMRANGVKFDKVTDWYAPLEAELRRFTGHARATHDDQVDMMSLMAWGFENMAEVDAEDFFTEEQMEFDRHTHKRDVGRSGVTGY